MFIGRVKALNAALARCPECGGDVAVVPEPEHSRFVARCCDAECGHCFSQPVRASALSLPGVIQIGATILCGLVAYLCASDPGRPVKVVAVVGAVIVGSAIARFVLRLGAHMVLQSSMPLGWKEEMIAYLAPPPFLTGSGEADPQPPAPGDADETRA